MYHGHRRSALQPIELKITPPTLSLLQPFILSPRDLSAISNSFRLARGSPDLIVILLEPTDNAEDVAFDEMYQESPTLQWVDHALRIAFRNLLERFRAKWRLEKKSEECKSWIHFEDPLLGRYEQLELPQHTIP